MLRKIHQNQVKLACWKGCWGYFGKFLLFGCLFVFLFLFLVVLLGSASPKSSPVPGKVTGTGFLCNCVVIQESMLLDRLG